MEKRIRLLTVIRHPVGGIRTYLKHTYGNLNKDRYRFTILTVEDEEGRLIEDDLKDLSMEVIRTRGQWRILELIWKVFRLCSLRRVDVIHSQGLTAGVLALIGNCFRTVPHIVTSHDVLRAEQFMGWTGAPKRQFLGLVLRRADAIHCVSEDVRRNLIEFLPALAKQEAKCVVITNGVSVRRILDGTTDQRRALRQELGLSQETVIFGFFGRFMPQKGFASLIDAIEVLAGDRNGPREFKVLAVNDGAFVREYKALIRERGLAEYFLFYGFAPEIDRMLLGVDAMVMPSFWEACPLLPMEAFVLGCPVIASECIGLREVVRDTPAVKVARGDHHCLAKSLAEVIKDREHFKRSAMEFIPVARSRFDVRRSSAQLDAALRRLSKGNSA